MAEFLEYLGAAKLAGKRMTLAITGAAALATAASACQNIYEVQPGDTLSGIAQNELGNIFAYQGLFDANRDVIGDNPNLIFAGMRLEMPCVDGIAKAFDWSVMPDATSLAALMERRDIQVLDIRSAKTVAKGVIPGALSVPYKRWSGPKGNPGKPPSEAQLAALIGGAGLRVDQPIVVVHSKPNMMDAGRAAKIYWLLKSSGAENLAILKGGFNSWSKAELPVAKLPMTPVPIETRVTFDTTWRADEVDVYGIATGQVDGHLLDARPHGFFSKLNAAGKAIATTLPGAQNAPVQPLMSVLSGEIDMEDGAGVVVEYLSKNNVNWTDHQVVSFCSSGELSALNWFYASELANLENMRLYPESVKGWAGQGGKLVPGSG